MPNSVILKSYSNIRLEYDAVAAITPGMLVELTSAGKVQAHSTAGGNAQTMFAFEDELQGKGINDAYAADDKVQVWHARPGDEVNAILPDGQNISIGDLLESAGDGMLQAHSPASEGAEYPEGVVAVALEAVDLSDSSAAESSGPLGYDKRIKVRIV